MFVSWGEWGGGMVWKGVTCREDSSQDLCIRLSIAEVGANTNSNSNSTKTSKRQGF